MRIIDDRYTAHRRSLDLAWRLITHEARTRTISRWTQLSHHRIRALYRSYAPQHHEQLRRHRGVSPYRLETILQSARLRFEAGIFAAICKSLRALPNQQLNDPERTLPSLDRGELVCDAFEWFRREVPLAELTIEQGMLVLNELTRGENVALATCAGCTGVVLSDRLSAVQSPCLFCTIGSRRKQVLSHGEPNSKLKNRS